MSFDAFCYFPKSSVKGETQDDHYGSDSIGAFEILEFTVTAKNNINIGSISSGGGAGKAEFEPIEIKKKTDTASASLFSYLCDGNHFAEMVIELRRSGGAAATSGAVFLEFRFQHVMIEEISWSGTDGEDICEETLKVEFGGIKISYRKQEMDGKMAKEPKVAMWSRLKNKADYEVKK